MKIPLFAKSKVSASVFRGRRSSISIRSNINGNGISSGVVISKSARARALSHSALHFLRDLSPFLPSARHSPILVFWQMGRQTDVFRTDILALKHESRKFRYYRDGRKSCIQSLTHFQASLVMPRQAGAQTDWNEKQAL